MAFNNVPVNGWPQIKDLEKLDAIAQAIENLPTFTSTDRDWMDEWEQKLPELPEDPEADGVKILKATTTSGETVKSWGDTELPADPVTDGVKVLTATTTSGETVKSWEYPESGSVDYSTTEQNTGVKWHDGNDIYFRTFTNVGVTPNASNWSDVVEIPGIAAIVKAEVLSDTGIYITGNGIELNINNSMLRAVYNQSLNMRTIGTLTIWYTKTTV